MPRFLQHLCNVPAADREGKVDDIRHRIVHRKLYSRFSFRVVGDLAEGARPARGRVHSEGGTGVDQGERHAISVAPHLRSCVHFQNQMCAIPVASRTQELKQTLLLYPEEDPSVEMLVPFTRFRTAQAPQ
jgi:hypothetical protein